MYDKIMHVYMYVRKFAWYVRIVSIKIITYHPHLFSSKQHPGSTVKQWPHTCNN